ncbi:MAG: ABC transporter substrate-binding protein, partial [Oscillospiraceae bacterium]|nr:ABC transporter substrate-binding protein [Oscillospiraceae bacterium]
MKKAICMVLVLAMALSLFAGCGSSVSPSQESSKTVEFTDDCGRTVTVPENISRIVPTGPLSQIVLFALCPEMFVGLASKWSSDSEGIIPEEFLSLPYFGQLYGSADLNVESLALAAPQIIIDIGEVKKSTAEDVEALRSQLGIPCVFIESTLESLPETYRKLGALLGLEERAETLASFC